MEWMELLIVVGLVVFLAWCFGLFDLLKRRMKGDPQEKNGK